MANLDPTTGVLTVKQSEIPQYLIRQAPPSEGLRRAMPEVRFSMMGYQIAGVRRIRKLNFQQLYSLRRCMPAACASIDFIKSRIMTFPFKIVTSKGKHNNLSQKRADKAEAVLRGPNQYGHTYRMIISMFLDNLLERDLGVIEKAKNPINITT